MLIGELVQKSGLSKDTLRHYEALGLIKSTPVQAGTRSYRDFGEDTLERLSMISYGKLMGATLKQMAPFIDRILSGEASEEERRMVLQGVLAEVEKRIADLETARAELNRMIADPNKPNADAAMKRLGLWIE